MSRHLGDDWLLPALDPHNTEWYTAGRLRIQGCDDCSALQHPPEDVCRSCQGTNLSYRDAGSEGVVESAVVVHHPVHPGLVDHLPYVIAVVSLEGAPGCNVVGNVVNREPGEVEIGQRVRAVFETVEDKEAEVTLHIPQWEVID